MSDDTNIGDIKLIIKYDNLIFILNGSRIKKKYIAILESIPLHDPENKIMKY